MERQKACMEECLIFRRMVSEVEGSGPTADVITFTRTRMIKPSVAWHHKGNAGFASSAWDLGRGLGRLKVNGLVSCSRLCFGPGLCAQMRQAAKKRGHNHKPGPPKYPNDGTNVGACLPGDSYVAPFRL